jgi:allophanate hydrolase subunit 2
MPGDTLTFHRQPTSTGAYAYLAVRGGFDVPLVMASTSTNLLAAIGGWQGRALLRGDQLEVGQQHIQPVPFTPGMDTAASSLTLNMPFRIVPGVQRARFSNATWRRLLSETFTISAEANRVGLRLLGPSLVPEDGADILSEGIATGSIQVTGEGQAIVMLPGHATIGGYTKIATVVSQDWDRLGQLSPGDNIRFCEFPRPDADSCRSR